MIEFPDQRQEDDYTCGTAILQGVFDLFRIDRSSSDDLATEADGLHPATLESVLRRAGFSVQSGQMTVEDLKHHTAHGRPVLCPIDQFGGHWVAVLAVARGIVWYHCPVGGRKKIREKEWRAIWRDHTRAGHPFDSWGIATWVES